MLSAIIQQIFSARFNSNKFSENNRFYKNKKNDKVPQVLIIKTKIYITYLTVGHSLLGQVIVDDKCVLAIVSEVLSHGATRVWR